MKRLTKEDLHVISLLNSDLESQVLLGIRLNEQTNTIPAIREQSTRKNKKIMYFDSKINLLSRISVESNFMIPRNSTVTNHLIIESFYLQENEPKFGCHALHSTINLTEKDLEERKWSRKCAIVEGMYRVLDYKLRKFSRKYKL